MASNSYFTFPIIDQCISNVAPALEFLGYISMVVPKLTHSTYQYNTNPLVPHHSHSIITTKVCDVHEAIH